MPWPWIAVAGVFAGIMVFVFALAIFVFLSDRKYSLPRTYTNLSFWLYLIMIEVLLAVGLEEAVIGVLRERHLIPERFPSTAMLWLSVLNALFVCGAGLAGLVGLIRDIRFLRRRNGAQR